MVIFIHGWYQKVVAVMIRCGVRFFLVSSRRFLTIVYSWTYTFVCILEERLFGVHAKEVLEDRDAFVFWLSFSRKVDIYHQLRFWMGLTNFCIKESMALCPWVTMSPQSPSVPKHLPEMIQWKSFLSLEIKKKNFRTSTSECTYLVFDLVQPMPGSRRRFRMVFLTLSFSHGQWHIVYKQKV